jgi:hypothetical protein
MDTAPNNSIQSDIIQHSCRLTKDGGIAWARHPVLEGADSTSQNVEYELDGIQFWGSSRKVDHQHMQWLSVKDKIP